MAYPLKGYQIAKNPEQPTLAILMLLTEKGPEAFAVDRGILEEMGNAFLRTAASLPRKTDLS